MSHIVMDKLIALQAAHVQLQEEHASMTTSYNHLHALVEEFIGYLDWTETSDSGRDFHPVTIGCCRAMMLEPLGKCVGALKESVKCNK